MKHYYISHMGKETKEKNLALYMEIKNNGKYINGGWNGDYIVSVYEYNNKIWELWDNMELGIISEVVERGEN